MGIVRCGITDSIAGRPGKRCSMCGRILEHWQFNASSSSRDGLQAYCRDCQRRYRSRHPAKEWKQDKKDGSLSFW